MEISDLTFDQDIVSHEAVLVDFWAKWCGPCKKMAPILDEIDSETNIKVLKLNVDENPKKMEEYSVHSIPTMVLFINGEPMHTIIGAKPKHILLKELDPWI